jgi:hypothetical protein
MAVLAVWDNCSCKKRSLIIKDIQKIIEKSHLYIQKCAGQDLKNSPISKYPGKGELSGGG